MQFYAFSRNVDPSDFTRAAVPGKKVKASQMAVKTIRRAAI